jgi:hypothetical protein
MCAVSAGLVAFARRVVPTATPRAIEPLGGGRSNASFRLRCGERDDFVIRAFTRDPRSVHAELAALEPYFSCGFAAGGGDLPDGWRNVARALDLAGIVAGLTKADLPLGADTELHALLTATLADASRP